MNLGVGQGFLTANFFLLSDFKRCVFFSSLWSFMNLKFCSNAITVSNLEKISAKFDHLIFWKISKREKFTLLTLELTVLTNNITILLIRIRDINVYLIWKKNTCQKPTTELNHGLFIKMPKMLLGVFAMKKNWNSK